MNNTSNPYSTYASNAQPKLHMDVSAQIKTHQEDEQQYSPKILPFTGDTLKEHLSQMYMTLLEIKKCINLTEKEPKRNKQAIKDSLEVITEIGKKITIDLPAAIAKLEI